MQAQCPLCSTRVLIDDAKVPERTFKVRCPKCQALITLPGRAQASAEAATPGVPPPAAPPPAPPPPPPPAPEARAGASAPREGPPAAPPPAPPPVPEAPPALLSEAALERAERAAAGERDAIVALAGPAADAVKRALEHLGYHVDVVEDIEEGARLLEQGVYEVAVTSRSVAEPGRAETLSQRMLRMPQDTRRGVFAVLVGEEFRSGDGTQAWAAQADLVLHPNDTSRAEHLIRATMNERKRLFQPYLDARRRVEAD